MQEPFVVVFDLETKDRLPAGVYGRRREEAVKELNISVACAVTIPARLASDPRMEAEAMAASQSYTYWNRSLSSMEGLLKLFDEAVAIVGYNIIGFDFPVLKRHYAHDSLGIRRHTHLEKSLDVFSKIRDVTGGWFKLDALLAENGLAAKTADGLQAIAMFAEGRFQQLEEYCLGDVQQCARLSLLPALNLPSTRGVATGITLTNHSFGIASFLASLQWSEGICKSMWKLERTRVAPLSAM